VEQSSSLLDDPDGERAEVRIHTHAQSSLIRGAIRNAARAVWQVGPKDRLTRISRRLALQAKDSFRMHALVQQPAAQEQVTRMVATLPALATVCRSRIAVAAAPVIGGTRYAAGRAGNRARS
jgi:hypothetical protein